MYILCGVELENDCVNKEFDGTLWEAVVGYSNALFQHLGGRSKEKSSKFTAGIAGLWTELLTRKPPTACCSHQVSKKLSSYYLYY
jgi:hypothetical protein